MSLRVGVAAISCALLLASCSSDPVAEPTPPVVGATPGTGAPFAEDVPRLGPSTALDEAVRAAGFDAGTAFVAAETRSSLDVVDSRSFVLTHDLPNGAVAEVTYRLSPGTGATAPDDGVTLDAEEEGDRYVLSLSYAIDADTLPEDIRDRLAAGSDGGSALRGTGGTTVAAAAGRPLAVRAQESPSTFDVVVDAVVNQAAETFQDSVVDRTGSKPASVSWEAWKAGNKVWDAVNANDLVAQALAKVDALAACAENPSNPLTIKQYAEDPSAKAKVTEQLAELKGEIQANAAALFLQLLADTGSSLAGSVKWLGFVVAPATAYVKQTLTSLIAERVREAEVLVPKCTKRSYTISGTIPSQPGGIEVEGTVCSLEKRYTATTTGDLVGTFSFRPNRETGGTFAYTGVVSNAGLRLNGSGAYSIRLSGDATTGTMTFDFAGSLNIPGFGTTTGTAVSSLDLVAIEPC